jgi:hypothetical protein
MKTEGIPNPNQERGQNEHKPSLKEKAVFQLKEFFGMFLYLWILFGLFVIHQSIILAQEHINYQAQGFAIINALILAKVMLIGEDLHLGKGSKISRLSTRSCISLSYFPSFLRLSHRRRGGSWSDKGEDDC